MTFLLKHVDYCSSISLALEPRRPDQRPPFVAFALLEGGQRLRRAAGGLEANLQKALARLGLGLDAGDLGVDAVDDGFRRSLGRIERIPRRDLETREALLGHRLHAGHQLARPERGDAERLQLAARHLAAC